ncbi:DUF805 domain-containing protein [Shewanella fidelis]|uniref:DUF805 domain-containing protein n=1 Tax=Shewanella fidelis TaxID=173509 RepID=A0AAW8NKD0_9GAMM|nr:DUF805 domain-containing protein [Shewanella fidelis]MDR8523126.1 DUF805 domain-containing protein [Shewanella fidelis]MDW4811548.1 DUF805 domain-containing protein [Shewanella fidelis]MDW4815669.1 DUF805 domain-containing protein [Shewanella fidelis]MDW4819759.1 DUF805 domain-containing protein [Shewanella fidelis]MDW4824267.1 DUF805 domain-containing protein [Shewanella fidelis]
MEYFIGPLKKYAEFSGRARRTEFWMFMLICFCIQLALTLLGLETISMLLSLALIVPNLSIGARRLHDTGRSGWWQLLLLIPLIGFIVLIVFWAQDSHSANNYGANPKEGVPA